MLEIKLFTDGGIRQGMMALGFVAYDLSDNEIFSGNRSCGRILSSSNIAEYRAIIAGLIMSLKNGVDIIHIYSDSQLAVKQITGAFSVNKPELRRHRDHVLELLEQFEDFSIKWVPRHENKRADALVNKVFERRNKKCVKRKDQRQRS